MKLRNRLLFLSGVILFFSYSFQNYFVCDDFEFLGRIDFSNAGTYFTHSWGYGNEYRPLLVFSYALNGAVGWLDPRLYHLVNTFLHAANALLVGAIFRRISFGPCMPFLMAAIFALNPVTHESVLWIAGRPVILSTLFALLAIWASLKAVDSEKAPGWWAVMYLSFFAGPLTYEGAVIVPLLLLLVHFWSAKATVRSPVRSHAGALIVFAGMYLIGWNLFFRFQITRFPVAHSAVDALFNFGKAVAHSFHGSSRLAAGSLYAVLLGILIAIRDGRRVLVMAFLWFVVAYLPFFIVRGYADRFAYLSSAATAFVLSSAIGILYSRKRSLGWIAASALLALLATGMVGRMRVWKHAGEIARQLPRDIKALHPVLAPGAALVLLHVPNTYRDAYVFLTGVERAVQLEYGNPALPVFREMYPGLPGNTVILDCSDGRVRDIGPNPPRTP